jgi:hypothetical protein
VEIGIAETLATCGRNGFALLPWPAHWAAAISPFEQIKALMTRIRFSRDRINANRDQGRLDPPIYVEEDEGTCYWTYGVKILGPAELFYQHAHPRAYVETGEVVRIENTVQEPKERNGVIYVYTWRGKIAEGKDPPLIARWGGRSHAAWHITIPGPSTILYSPHCPLRGTSGHGVRLWIETHRKVSPGSKKWAYPWRRVQTSRPQPKQRRSRT